MRQCTCMYSAAMSDELNCFSCVLHFIDPPTPPIAVSSVWNTPPRTLLCRLPYNCSVASVSCTLRSILDTVSAMENFGRTSAVAAAGFGVASIAIYSALASRTHHQNRARRVIASPRTTLLPRLSQDQIDRLPYSPSVLPGARDVQTPLGTMRVNEWGSETGKRILFVHGDATPSPMFRTLANELVAKGCRVMTFGQHLLDLYRMPQPD